MKAIERIEQVTELAEELHAKCQQMTEIMADNLTDVEMDKFIPEYNFYLETKDAAHSIMIDSFKIQKRLR